MLTRCNQCGKLFKDDNGLVKVVEIFDPSGLSYRLYNSAEPIDESFEEIIDACPNCMTDEYLMDLGDIGLKEVSKELNYRGNAADGMRWDDELAHISTDELEVMETILEQN